MFLAKNNSKSGCGLHEKDSFTSHNGSMYRIFTIVHLSDARRIQSSMVLLYTKPCLDCNYPLSIIISLLHIIYNILNLNSQKDKESGKRNIA